jgi:hypothetical protein
VAVDLGALPGMLSSPPHQPALFAAAFVACSLAIAALVLRRRRPGALATLAFAAAGAVLLCLVMLFDLAGQGSDLRLAFDVWRSPQLAAVREAVRELRLLALAMLVPVLLAGAAGILAFARGTRPSESLG